MLVMDQAKAKGVGRDVLAACGRMLDNAVRAKRIRDGAV
jgi:hypothetical protein